MTTEQIDELTGRDGGKIVYSILYSEEHIFYYHPDFHPGRENEIAQRGWRAIVRATAGEFSVVKEAILGLNKKNTEEVAAEFAQYELYDKLHKA